MTEKGHGREEVRRVWLYRDVEELHRAKEFAGFCRVVRVQSLRTIKGLETSEDRYYITDRQQLTAASGLEFVRRHWAIENELHWMLDVAFSDDDCKVLAARTAENLSHIRAACLPILRSAPGPKVGAETRRMMAGWSDEFLETLLLGGG